MAQAHYKYNMSTAVLWILLFSGKQMSHYYMIFLLITSFLSQISGSLVNPWLALVKHQQSLWLWEGSYWSLWWGSWTTQIWKKNRFKIAENVNSRCNLIGSNLELWPYTYYKSWSSRDLYRLRATKTCQRTDDLGLKFEVACCDSCVIVIFFSKDTKFFVLLSR